MATCELNFPPFSYFIKRKGTIMTRILFAALVIPALVVVTTVAAEKADKKGPDLSKVTCPVSGKAVKADATAKHNDGDVYFCCGKCCAAFAKDATKWATKANGQLVATGQAKQKGCPISGKATKDGTEVTVAGAEVKFCCNGCKGKVNKAKGDAQLDLVFSDKAFKKAFAVGK